MAIEQDTPFQVTIDGELRNINPQEDQHDDKESFLLGAVRHSRRRIERLEHEKEFRGNGRRRSSAEKRQIVPQLNLKIQEEKARLGTLRGETGSVLRSINIVGNDGSVTFAGLDVIERNSGSTK